MSERSPSEVADSLEKMQDRLVSKVISNAIRRGMRAGAKVGKLAVRQGTGLGAALWANRNSKRRGISGTPPLIVKPLRVRRSGDTFTSGVEAKGIAALIDQGGNIKAHRIPGAFGHKGGVMHPGSAVRQAQFMPTAAETALDTAGKELDLGVAQAAQELGL